MSAEWATPPDLFARLNRWFRFDYDAFASHENAVIMNPPFTRDFIVIWRKALLLRKEEQF